MTSNLKPTFAEKTKKKIQPIHNFNHPTEEQGLIFKHVEGATIREYLLIIYKMVGGARNIVAASRVSGGKVILFLASKDLVDKFQEDHGGFTFGSTYITTRKLQAPAVKIILSNVSPIIPNSVIEEQLVNTFKLKLISPISILRINPNDDLFAHIICWRRQVYAHHSTNPTHIPATFEINYANRSYRIFLTTDNLVCFKCGTKGHKAETCPHVTEEEFEDTTYNQNDTDEANDIVPSHEYAHPLPLKRETNNNKRNAKKRKSKKGGCPL